MIGKPAMPLRLLKLSYLLVWPKKKRVRGVKIPRAKVLFHYPLIWKKVPIVMLFFLMVLVGVTQAQGPGEEGVCGARPHLPGLGWGCPGNAHGSTPVYLAHVSEPASYVTNSLKLAKKVGWLKNKFV